MSDHGMGRASRFVVLNNLLLETGFLCLKRDPLTRIKAFAFRRGLTLRNVHRLADRLGVAKHAEYKNVYSFDAILKKIFLSFDNVDWGRTRAYSFGRHYGAVFLNVRGREPLGCVDRGAEYERTRDEIVDALSAYVDRDLGRPLVGRCIKGEDVYHGAHADEAPDLVLLPIDESDIFYGLSDFGSNRVWDSTYRYSGMHRDHGLLIAEGPGIRAGHAVGDARIIDIAPTCLHWLGLEIPGDMDGRALEDVFADDFRRGHPVRVTKPSMEPTVRGERVFSPSEEDEILQRLRDLGYLN